MELVGHNLVRYIVMVFVQGCKYGLCAGWPRIYILCLLLNYVPWSICLCVCMYILYIIYTCVLLLYDSHSCN